MHIGDRVRLLHGQEEGIITNILPNNILEIEIEDGFVIPVLRNEVALVFKEESIHFQKEKSNISGIEKPESQEEIVGAKGIYFAFIILNDQEVSLHLANNTDYVLLYAISEMQGGKFFGISHGSLDPKSSEKIKNFRLHNFENWPVFFCQFIYHRKGYFASKEPFIKPLKLKASTFFKRKGKSPVIGKEGYIIQLDESSKHFDIDPEKLREKILDTAPHEMQSISPPEEVFDLHIEKLVKDSSGMTKAGILGIQLEAFRQALDRAIIAGMDQIIFIHGVGNGALKKAIQKEASQMKNIRYYKDAMKEKFGYGATLIQIK